MFWVLILSKNMKILLSSEQKFSISTDASNKGNIKLFPVAIHYFDVNEGLVNFIIDFYDDPNESSNDIHKNLIKILNSNKLNIENLIGYGADNASVNYGAYHSVYKYLKSENSFIIKANCNAHLLHNTAKHGLLKLPLDIENLISKVYNHFCISAKRLKELKSCYEFTENEYSKILKHVPTRWPSLFAAIDRLIINLEAVKLYFTGIKSDDCDEIISNFFFEYDKNNECNLTLNECFLFFAHNYMKLFHESILI